jgi:disulfide bond formation protein DsbB
MGLAIRLLLGAAGFVAVTALAIEDARLLRARVGLPMAWLLLGMGAMVIAGLIHLALTPEHWDEARLYGAFFLASGVAQLVLASLFIRPGAGISVAALFVAANLFLIAVYVGSRIVPPFGADLPESLDALGLATVVAEGAAAVVGLALARRLSAARSVRAPRGTVPSCPDPRARAGDSGTRTDR